MLMPGIAPFRDHALPAFAARPRPRFGVVQGLDLEEGRTKWQTGKVRTSLVQRQRAKIGADIQTTSKTS